MNDLSWQQQMDYIYFFYGLAFILLAPICANFHYMKEKSLPWKWLGLFACLHGINEWLDMSVLSLGDTTLYSSVRTGIMALSFIILIVFGCEGLFKKSGKSTWLCCLTLLAVFSIGSYQTGGAGSNAMVRYSFGIAGGLLSAIALFRASKAEENVNRPLSFAALFMALYAFASGVIVPAAPFFPASIINNASFISTTGVPIQLVRGIVVVFISISIWIYHQQISKVMDLSANGKNNFGYHLCIALLVIVSAGWVCTDLFGRHTETDERSDKLHQAEIAAAAIDPKCIDYVTEAPSDSNGHTHLHNQLLNILKTNSQIKRLYLMPLSGEKVFESVPNGGSGIYNTAGKHVRSPKEIFNAFAAEKAIITDPYRDETRLSQSIFATIRDPGSARIIAVLGLDFKADDLPFIIARHRLMPICITCLIALLSIIYYMMRQRAWESSQTIAINEQRLLESQSIAHLGSWEYDLEKNVEYWSAELNRILGLQDEESGIVRESLIDHIHQDDRGHVKEMTTDTLKSGMPYEVDYRILRPDGTERFVHSQGKALTRGNGKTVKIIGTILDITARKQTEVALRESEFFFKESQSAASIGSYKADFGSDYWESSEVLDTIFGIDKGYDRRIQGWLDIVHPNDRTMLDRYLKVEVISKRNRFSKEYRIVRKNDGETRWVNGLGAAIFDRNGNVTTLIGTIQDITDRKQAEEGLLLFKESVENSTDAIGMSSPEGKHIYQNKSFTNMFDEFGDNPPELFVDENVGKEMFNAVMSGGQWVGEVKMYAKNKRVLDILLRSYANKDANGRIIGLVGIHTDITERKLSEEKIRDLAYTDHLTGLPNRLLFLDRCEQAIAVAKRNGTLMALLFLDLDHFKDINDTLGHHAGDLFLKAVSSRILKILRSSNTIARLGGDEFALLCSSIICPQDASIIANRIIEQFHQPFEIEGKIIFSSASIGIVIYPDDGSDSSTLLKNADLAMYAAKERGRNAFNFFSDELNQKAQERATIEEGLRQAIQSDQLLLHYQPQVDLRSGRVIGVETLCRWLHPVLGFIAPDKFIPIAEKTGLIRHIGDWVLKTACRQCKEWHLNGFPLTVAVNVSISQLRFLDFPERVKEVLDEAGLSPEYLELEITESLLMNNAEESLEMLSRLKSIGVKIAIDDFGTGYSSLSYLNKFPLDRIKIDKSFIREITLRDDSASIVSAIVAIGHSLGLKVIAEGIETKEEQEMMLKFSCDEAQGYHYSKPIPAFDVGRLIYSNIPLGKPILLDNPAGVAMPIAIIDSMKKNSLLLNESDPNRGQE